MATSNFDNVTTEDYRTDIGTFDGWTYGPGAGVAKSSSPTFGSVNAHTGSYAAWLNPQWYARRSYITTMYTGLTTSSSYTFSFRYRFRAGFSIPDDVYVNLYDPIANTVTTCFAGQPTTSSSFSLPGFSTYTPTTSSGTIMVIVAVQNEYNGGGSEVLIDTVSVLPNQGIGRRDVTISLPEIAFQNFLVSSPLVSPQLDFNWDDYAASDSQVFSVPHWRPTVGTRTNMVRVPGASFFADSSGVGGISTLWLNPSQTYEVVSTIFRNMSTTTSYTISFYATFPSSTIHYVQRLLVNVTDGGTVKTIFNGRPESCTWKKYTCAPFVPTSSTMGFIMGGFHAAPLQRMYTYIDRFEITPFANITLGRTGVVYNGSGWLEIRDVPGMPQEPDPSMWTIGDFSSITSTGTIYPNGVLGNWLFSENSAIGRGGTTGPLGVYTYPTPPYGACLFSTTAKPLQYISTLINNLTSTYVYTINLNLRFYQNANPLSTVHTFNVFVTDGTNTQVLFAEQFHNSTDFRWKTFRFTATARSMYLTCVLGLPASPTYTNPPQMIIEKVQVAPFDGLELAAPTFFQIQDLAGPNISTLSLDDFTISGSSLVLSNQNHRNTWAFGPGAGIWRNVSGAFNMWLRTTGTETTSYAYTGLINTLPNVTHTLVFTVEPKGTNPPGQFVINTFDGTTLTRVYDNVPSSTQSVTLRFTPTTTSTLMIFGISQFGGETSTELLIRSIGLHPGTITRTVNPETMTIFFDSAYAQIPRTIETFDSVTTSDLNQFSTITTSQNWIWSINSGVIKAATSGMTTPTGEFAAWLQTFVNPNAPQYAFAYTYLTGLTIGQVYRMTFWVSQRGDSPAHSTFYVNACDESWRVYPTIYSGAVTTRGFQICSGTFQPLRTRILVCFIARQNTNETDGQRNMWLDNIRVTPGRSVAFSSIVTPNFTFSNSLVHKTFPTSWPSPTVTSTSVLSSTQTRSGTTSLAMLDYNKVTVLQNLPANSMFNFQWSIEFFVYNLGLHAGGITPWLSTPYYDLAGGIFIGLNSSRKLLMRVGSIHDFTWNLVNFTSTTTYNLNQWHHVRLSWNWSNYSVHVNGTRVNHGSTSINVGPVLDKLFLGCTHDNTSSTSFAAMHGYIDALRVRVTGTEGTQGGNVFTVPSVPYTSDDFTMYVNEFEGTDGSSAIPPGTLLTRPLLIDDGVIKGASGQWVFSSASLYPTTSLMTRTGFGRLAELGNATASTWMRITLSNLSTTSTYTLAFGGKQKNNVTINNNLTIYVENTNVGYHQFLYNDIIIGHTSMTRYTTASFTPTTSTITLVCSRDPTGLSTDIFQLDGFVLLRNNTGSTPGVVTSLNAMVSNQSITYTWSPPTNVGGADILGYDVVFQNSSSSRIQGTSITYTNLVNNMPYNFTICAVNEIGAGTSSQLLNVQPTDVPVVSPETLSGVNASGVLTLTWSSVSGATGYVLQYGPVGSTFTPTTLSTSLLTTSVSGLTLGAAYAFSVASTNAAGSSLFGNSINLTPLSVPSMPRNVSGTTASGRSVITWLSPLNNGGTNITSYSLEYWQTSNRGGTQITLTNVSSGIVLSNLQNRVSYTVVVKAENSQGSGPDSSGTSFTPAMAPSAAVLQTITPGNAQLILTWLAPTDNGGSVITSYIVRYWRSGLSPVTITGITGTSRTITGLTNGLLHTVEVYAVNAIGTGQASSTLTTTPATVPSAPTSFTASGVNSGILMSWAAPTSNGGSSVLSYTVRYQASGQSLTLIPNVMGTSYTVTNLVNGRSYTVSVLAVNAIGDGTVSTQITRSAGALPDPPRVQTVVPSDGKISISWYPPLNTGGFAITSYKINGSTTSTTATVSGSLLTYSFTGLTNGTSYTLTMQTVTSFALSASTSTYTVTPATYPSRPLDVTVTPASGSATLAFSSSVSDGGFAIQRYEARYWTGSNNPTQLSSVVPGQVITSLLNEETYVLQVRAVTSFGSSEWSDTATFIPSSYADDELLAKLNEKKSVIRQEYLNTQSTLGTFATAQDNLNSNYSVETLEQYNAEKNSFTGSLRTASALHQEIKKLNNNLETRFP